jgi:uncharacterized protein (DUF2141 family)
VSLLLLFSCANPIPPVGGPKDSRPPAITKTLPPNRSTQISPTKIILFTDEYIQLDNPAENISIIPPLNGEFKYNVKGKSLHIHLPDGALSANTTYTIRFGAAIKDFNEGNVQDSFSFVFATGRYLDSLKLKGTVTQAETGLPEDNFLVGLYHFSDDDSLPYKAKPYYYVKTDKNGCFSLENLKAGTYKVVGFKDENYNYIKDLPTERMAFVSHPVTLSDSGNSFTLRSFIEKTPVRIVEITTKLPYLIILILSDKADSVRLEPFAGELALEHIFYQFNASRDTVKIYHGFNRLMEDSFKIILNGVPADTLKLKFKTTNPDSIRLLLPSLGLASAQPVAAAKKSAVLSPTESPKTLHVDFFEPLMLNWNRPIVSRETTKVSLYQVLDSVKTPVAPFFMDTESPFFWKILPENGFWHPGAQYEIHIADSVLHDYFFVFNRSMHISFSTSKPEDYGEVFIRLQNLNKSISYITELTDATGKIVSRETFSGKNSQVFHYQKVKAGIYQLKIIEDTNNNGQWDTGNYFEKKQPEYMYLFPEKINVRAKWENEVIFNIQKENVKNDDVDN